MDTGFRAARLAAILAATLLLPAMVSAGSPPKQTKRTSTAAVNKPPPHRPATHDEHATRYYMAAWGVDRMRVSRVASGTLIRFTYRVSDPVQAAALRDKAATPVLYAPRAHAQLSVPIMEKIGPLRQTGALEAGREYWIAFSNKGNLVRPGDRVNVSVGRFHAEGLLVD
jgi:hypothetical protein